MSLKHHSFNTRSLTITTLLANFVGRFPGEKNEKPLEFASTILL